MEVSLDLELIDEAVLEYKNSEGNSRCEVRTNGESLGYFDSYIISSTGEAFVTIKKVKKSPPEEEVYYEEVENTVCLLYKTELSTELLTRMMVNCRRAGISGLLSSPLGSDFIVTIGRQRFYLHSFVIARRSDYFAMLISRGVYYCDLSEFSTAAFSTVLLKLYSATDFDSRSHRLFAGERGGELTLEIVRLLSFLLIKIASASSMLRCLRSSQLNYMAKRFSDYLDAVVLLEGQVTCQYLKDILYMFERKADRRVFFNCRDTSKNLRRQVDEHLKLRREKQIAKGRLDQDCSLQNNGQPTHLYEGGDRREGVESR